MQISVIINMFVTCVFAAGFYGRTEHEDIGLANAGYFLGQRYGPHITYIWALGLLAAGQSSTMTGCYTGQFVMGGYLQLNVSPWLRVLVTRAVALVPTLLVALLSQNPTSLDVLNQWLNLLQSLQLPFALIPVVAFNSSKALMGDFANGTGMTLITGVISLVVMLVNISGVYSFTGAVMQDATTLGWAALGLVILLYVGFICYLFVHASWVAGLLPESVAPPFIPQYLPLEGGDGLQPISRAPSRGDGLLEQQQQQQARVHLHIAAGSCSDSSLHSELQQPLLEPPPAAAAAPRGES
jgi:natural resistance-associated macrophage protein